MINDRKERPWSFYREKTLRKAVFDPKADKPRSVFSFTDEIQCLWRRTGVSHSPARFNTHTFTFTHLYVLTPKACHSHIFKKSLVPHLNKHFLGPWSNNYGNNIQRPAMTGIISALFINKVICEVLPTGGRKNMLTCSNGIWPNGNDILTAAICNAGAPMSCQRVVQYWGNTMRSLIVPPVEI